MESNHYKKIKYELSNIRGQREILESRLDNLNFYNNPFVFAKEFLKSGNISRINLLKDKIYLRDVELSKKYISLRKEYSNRFDKMENSDLIVKYERLCKRIDNLRKREYKLECKKPNSRGSSRKRLDAVLEQIDIEKSRRERVLHDIIREFERDRGISLEQYYMNDFHFKRKEIV